MEINIRSINMCKNNGLHEDCERIIHHNITKIYFYKKIKNLTVDGFMEINMRSINMCKNNGLHEDCERVIHHNITKKIVEIISSTVMMVNSLDCE